MLQQWAVSVSTCLVCWWPPRTPPPCRTSSCCRRPRGCGSRCNRWCPACRGSRPWPGSGGSTPPGSTRRRSSGSTRPRPRSRSSLSGPATRPTTKYFLAKLKYFLSKPPPSPRSLFWRVADRGRWRSCHNISCNQIIIIQIVINCQIPLQKLFSGRSRIKVLMNLFYTGH